METDRDRILTRIVNEVPLSHRALLASALEETMQREKDKALAQLAQEEYTQAFAASYAARCIGDLMYGLTSSGVLADTSRVKER